MNSYSIRVASYNIHGCIGADSHFVPNRIIDVLREIDADVVALQEVESRTTGIDMLEFIGTALSMHAIPGSTLLTADGDYGNGMLTRLPVVNTRTVDLSHREREPRGAIDVKLKASSSSAAPALRVIATHLGLRAAERRAQVRQLLSTVGNESNLPTVFMGDINEWYFGGRPLRWLHRRFSYMPAIATFPARFPLFALDRIWVQPHGLVQQIYVHGSVLARKASDHLPIVADIRIFEQTKIVDR